MCHSQPLRWAKTKSIFMFPILTLQASRSVVIHEGKVKIIFTIYLLVITYIISNNYTSKLRLDVVKIIIVCEKSNVPGK